MNIESILYPKAYPLPQEKYVRKHIVEECQDNTDGIGLCLRCGPMPIELMHIRKDLKIGGLCKKCTDYDRERKVKAKK